MNDYKEPCVYHGVSKGLLGGGPLYTPGILSDRPRTARQVAIILNYITSIITVKNGGII